MNLAFNIPVNPAKSIDCEKDFDSILQASPISGLACYIKGPSSSSNKQATTNQQVGVQDGIGVGAGATSLIGSTDIGGLSLSGASTVNITSSDLAAIDAVEEIAKAGVNAANTTSIRALETLQLTQREANIVASNAVNKAQETALASTPGAVGAIVGDATTKNTRALLIVAGISLVVIGTTIYLIKKRKSS